MAKRASDNTHELVFFLVRRFIIALLAVLAVDAAILWLELVFLLPVLPGLSSTPVGSWIARLLALAALLLLALPIVTGALLFARAAARKMRAMQDEREAELARIDEERNAFLTDIAHDLRTPMMAISGMAHALADGVVRDDATRDEYLASIGAKADKMGELVTSVFDYAKLGGGEFSLDRENVDLPQLLLAEAAAVYGDYEAAGIALSVDVPEERCTVFADRLQLSRVIANLLANALRHNERGTEVALVLRRGAGMAYVSVADTGAAIAMDADELFRPFSQGDASRGSAGGSGLGLSICKRICDMHGYRLTLEQPWARFTKAFMLRCATSD